MGLQYQETGVHRWMLRDRQRVDAFERAIADQLRPGSVVLDVGAGSGILSLIAARAGARRVYAVEATPIARLARELAALNGYAHVIQMVEGDVLHAQLPEAVDLIVSEWLGSVGVDENLLYPVLIARDRWLKPGGTMLPSKVSAWLAPCALATACETGFFRNQPYGFELGPLAEYSVHDLLLRRYQVRPEDLVCAAALLWRTDCAALPARQALEPSSCKLRFECREAREVNALVGWFEAELAAGVVLTNAPDAPETHWGQLTLPLAQRIGVVAGDRLDVQVACIPRTPGISDWSWSLRVNGGPWTTQDTRTACGNFDPYGMSRSPAPATFSPCSQGGQRMSQHAQSANADTQAAPVALPPVQQAATITCFLARLSVDADLLYRLIVDPRAVLEESGLSADEIAALMSREASQIEQAMMKGTQL